MQQSILFFCLMFLFSCKAQLHENTEKESINLILNQWHQAASDAKYDDYFNKMHASSIFIGTDATENWDKPAFMKYAKPHFDKGKAWKFKVLERNLFLSNDGKMAWFDELLDTSMKICRGSGVLVFENNQWLIKHYVLSMTIPNDIAKTVIEIKKEIEDKLINQLNNN
jgi:hypothetical protein